MLIKCPECGREISDKAPHCIHCGYPLTNETPNSYNNNSSADNIIFLDGKSYNITKILNETENKIAYEQDEKIKSIKALREKYGWTLKEAKTVADEIYRILYPNNNAGSSFFNTPICPYCHSTNTKKISGLAKGLKVAFWGNAAAGQIAKQWHCNNCGSDF